MDKKKDKHFNYGHFISKENRKICDFLYNYILEDLGFDLFTKSRNSDEVDYKYICYNALLKHMGFSEIAFYFGLSKGSVKHAKTRVHYIDDTRLYKKINLVVNNYVAELEYGKDYLNLYDEMEIRLRKAEEKIKELCAK